MRHVDDAQHAEDERQTQRHQKQQACVREAVGQCEQEQVRRHVDLAHTVRPEVSKGECEQTRPFDTSGRTEVVALITEVVALVTDVVVLMPETAAQPAPAPASRPDE